MGALRVLLVDDEAEFVSTVEERLRIRGIEAEALTSGAEAVRRLTEREFDVVVADMRMPGMDGLELLRQVKKIRPATRVILLTGRGSEQDSESGLEHGASDYLIKPINIDDLIDRMKKAVGA
ncbi:MAG: response regulator [Candidatus Zixiibacteriota bacterium]